MAAPPSQKDLKISVNPGKPNSCVPFHQDQDCDYDRRFESKWKRQSSFLPAVGNANETLADGTPTVDTKYQSDGKAKSKHQGLSKKRKRFFFNELWNVDYMQILRQKEKACPRCQSQKLDLFLDSLLFLAAQKYGVVYERLGQMDEKDNAIGSSADHSCLTEKVSLTWPRSFRKISFLLKEALEVLQMNNIILQIVCERKDALEIVALSFT